MVNGEDSKGTDTRSGEGSLFNDGQERRPSSGEIFDSEAQERNSTEGRSEALGGQGQIYFIETEDGNFIKIGFSKQVIVRLSQLGTLRPGHFSLRVVGSMPGSIAIEKWLHERFAEERDNGEWFKRTPRLSAFIDSIGLIAPIILPKKARIPKAKKSRALYIRPDPEQEQESGSQAKSIPNPNAVALGSMGGRPASPTKCPRCGEMQPSARQAWLHCRGTRTEAAKKAAESRWAGKKQAAKKK